MARSALAIALVASCGGGAKTPPDAAPDATIARFVIDTTMVSFGDVELSSTTSARRLTITNAGGDAMATARLTTTLAGMESPHYAIVANTCNGHVLATAESCTLDVVFHPTSLGIKAVVLTVGSLEASVETMLSGTGIGALDTAVTPSAVAFGTIAPGMMPTQSVVVTNPSVFATGPVWMSITGPNAAAFQ